MALFPAVYSIQDGVTSILVLDLSIRRQIFLLLLRCKGGLLSSVVYRTRVTLTEKGSFIDREKDGKDKDYPRFVIPSPIPPRHIKLKKSLKEQYLELVKIFWK